MGLFNRKKRREEKPRKAFKDTKFAGFIKKVGKKIPDLAGDVLEIATSGNPVGSMVGMVKDKLEHLSNDGDIQAKGLLHELEEKRAEWEHEFKMYNLDIEDRKSARQMYISKNQMADGIARSIINWNLPVIASLLLIEIACIFYLKEYPEILALISAAVGGVTQALISERLTVVQFFFGSSRGSKEKQDILNGKKEDVNTDK